MWSLFNNKCIWWEIDKLATDDGENLSWIDFRCEQDQNLFSNSILGNRKKNKFYEAELGWELMPKTTVLSGDPHLFLELMEGSGTNFSIQNTSTKFGVAMRQNWRLMKKRRWKNYHCWIFLNILCANSNWKPRAADRPRYITGGCSLNGFLLVWLVDVEGYDETAVVFYGLISGTDWVVCIKVARR